VDNGTGKQLSGQINVRVTVARLANMPAGNYVLSSTAQAEDFVNSGEFVSCEIHANGTPIAGSSAVVGNGAGSVRVAVLSSIGAVSKSDGFQATLECFVDQSLGQPPGVENAHLSAVKVQTLRVSGSP
jgi:hypothetical protein